MSSKSEKLGSALAERVKGPVQSDEKTLARYATDWSIYYIPPLAVVTPQDTEDIVALVRFAREEGIPITPRGGGTSTSGSALGRGIVLAFSKSGPMDRVVDFVDGPTGPLIRAEPALRHDKLQAYLQERGQFLPSDPTSGPISLLGGNVAAKASGPHALKHGSIDRYVKHLKFVSADGDVVDTADEATIPGNLRDGVVALRREITESEGMRSTLEGRKDLKTASGYNMFTFLRDESVGETLAQLLVGSVGTLGFVTESTLSSVPYIPGKATTLLYFKDLHEAGDAVQHIRGLGVAAIEIMNSTALELVRERNPDLPLPPDACHTLLVEYEGDHLHDQIGVVERVLKEQGYGLAAPFVTVEGEKEQEQVWKARKSLLPVLRNYKAGYKALSVVNDVGVDPRHLASFIKDLERLFEKHDLVTPIYGHAGSGNLHLRPLFDVNRPDLPGFISRIADEVYDTVIGYGGTITAEHGMGRSRAPFLEREWGGELTGFMRRIKTLFDPDDLLNPDAMFTERGFTEDMAPLL
jgi:FAD/FMN-containing dehydrogenase